MKQLGGSASGMTGAALDDCLALLVALDRYPTWHPQVVRSAEVLERDELEQPRKGRALLHVQHGPLVHDFDLLLRISVDRPTTVSLTRIANERSDAEGFAATWSLQPGERTRIQLDLRANLDVPRFLPVGGVGNSMAAEFVAAAVRALGA